MLLLLVMVSSLLYFQQADALGVSPSTIKVGPLLPHMEITRKFVMSRAEIQDPLEITITPDPEIAPYVHFPEGNVFIFSPGSQTHEVSFTLKAPAEVPLTASGIFHISSRIINPESTVSVVYDYGIGVKILFSADTKMIADTKTTISQLEYDKKNNHLFLHYLIKNSGNSTPIFTRAELKLLNSNEQSFDIPLDDPIVLAPFSNSENKLRLSLPLLSGTYRYTLHFYDEKGVLLNTPLENTITLSHAQFLPYLLSNWSAVAFFLMGMSVVSYLLRR